MRISLLAAAAALALIAAGPAGAEEGKPVIGTWGFDVSGMDRSVKPGDDFNRFANGAWDDRTPIPPERVRWGSFDILRDKAEQDVIALVEALDPASGAGARKIVDFYRAYTDVAAIEAAGLAPARPWLDRIAAAKTHDEVAKLMWSPDMPAGSVVSVFVNPDSKNPDAYAVYVRQSGLVMPDRDYYLKDEAQFAEIRKKYVAYLAQLFTLAGQDDAEGRAGRVMALETEIAKRHWERARTRQRDLTYNLKPRAELSNFAPGFPWDAAIEAGGFAPQAAFVVGEQDAVQSLAALFAETPVETWRDYLTARFLNANADVLPKAFDEASFAFNNQVILGQQEILDRRKRAVAALNGALGEAVGELYVARHFPPAAKAAMDELIDNVLAAYAERIRELPWMTAETRALALQKLSTFRPKIGYPSKWRDYAALEVKAGDALGNAVRARAFEWRRRTARLGQPTDRDEWGMTPQTVNAYYSSTFNEIVFPAAILQPPFFDPNADAAVNYGGIGAVIGHEIGHGFDDQGSKSDPRGVLRDWWKPEDRAAFEKLVDKMDALYSGFEPLPGLRVNGRLSAGENIADVGGLNVAYRAYQMHLDKQPAGDIDGFTPSQRFFLGFAQIWRAKQREAQLRNQLIQGPHSPPQVRANGTVRNVDGWYDAFDVQPGQKLYLAPDARVLIW